MNSLIFVALAATIAVCAGCSGGGDGGGGGARSTTSRMPATAPASNPAVATVPTTRGVFGLPPGWELAPGATYSARQRGGEVTIKATGQHNTGGYQTRLVQSPLRIWPPQWMMAQKPPDGIVTQAITPFEATASFKADEPIAAVRISDAAGRHDVKVEQGD